MDISRALPRPELRSVLRSFGERCVDLGSAGRTWPVAARPHQMLQFHLAEPYRVRHDNGPASLMPQTYVSGPLTYQRVQIYLVGPDSCFQHSVSPDWLEPVDRNQHGVACQRRPRGFGCFRQIGIGPGGLRTLGAGLSFTCRGGRALGSDDVGKPRTRRRD